MKNGEKFVVPGRGYYRRAALAFEKFNYETRQWEPSPHPVWEDIQAHVKGREEKGGDSH
jgi:hypothetical protein